MASGFMSVLMMTFALSELIFLSCKGTYDFTQVLHIYAGNTPPVIEKTAEAAVYWIGYICLQAHACFTPELYCFVHQALITLPAHSNFHISTRNVHGHLCMNYIPIITPASKQ